jgi:diguanylate cyclase (GGDEF)-like protein/PAS domain S-box-containing protein
MTAVAATKPDAHVIADRPAEPTAAKQRTNEPAPTADHDGSQRPSDPPATLRARTGKQYSRRVIFLPMIVALIVIWSIVAGFTVSERSDALERARSQLENAVSTLVELSVLAERSAQGPARVGDPDSTAVFWRILLQYPAAWIWIETDGKITAGQPPPPDTKDLIVVNASSGILIAHAGLKEADALIDWRHSAFIRLSVLASSSIGFLFLATLLSRALNQRAAAERDAVAAEERSIQLRRYQTQLEETVARRTAELSQSNSLLGTELAERLKAVAVLHQHDALLAAVTKGAAALLEERDFREAILEVGAMIGPITAVGRVQFAAIRHEPDGHFISSTKYEWCAAGTPRLLDNADLADIDLTALVPAIAALLANGKLGAVCSDDLSSPGKDMFVAAGIRSVLMVPVRVNHEWTGSLNFIDSVQTRRTWSWAETDTLTTLAELVGSAITRAQNNKELADANMIVQNSPTVLFRLKGEPGLPLIYISQNIVKFGHSPAELIASAAWPLILVDEDDRASVWTALTKVLEKDASSASIEFRLIAGSGSRHWMEARYSPVRDKGGRLIEVEGIMIDVTERKAAEEKILRLARTDPLTGLANRATFAERLHLAFNASRRGGSSIAVLYLDLDHFKDVNDTLGHPMGDSLLTTVAARLLSAVRETDLVARFGGDEFAILQADVGDPAVAGALAEKIRLSLDRPYVLDGNILNLTTSIGVAPLGADTVEADAMLAQADLALYRAKEEGRNQYRFHSKDLDDEVRERVDMASDLRKAIENDELELYYQPQVNLTSGVIVGMEALARWHHATRGMIMPSVFIAIAEKTGLILPLGRWVLDEACGQMRQWQDAGIAPPVLAVNVSMLQLRNAQEFVSTVTETLAKWALDPARLEIDVTEAMLAQVSWTRNDVLMELRRLGVLIAIDDFGTGFSSFDYIQKFAINHIKIARSFIATATSNPEHARTIHAIVGLARDLQIDVIAEGVETADERALLVSLGATTQGQGLYFSAAVNAAHASDLLRRGIIAQAADAPVDQSIAAQTLPNAEPHGGPVLIEPVARSPPKMTTLA